MWLEELYGQRLLRIELTEPWPTTGIASTGRQSLLAGAITLVFEQHAVMCTSPLRYSHCQNGTVTTMFDTKPRDLGFRFTVLPTEDAESLPRECSLPRLSFSAATWLRAESSAPSAPPPLLQAGIGTASRTSTVRLHMLNVGWQELTYRPDLDGCIELAPPNVHQATPGEITVSSPDGAFGWLHPASRHPFVLDGQYWRTAHPSDWPWPLAREWRSQQHGNEYRKGMKAALLARFQQHDHLRRRLLALGSRATVAAVPKGLIEEVAEQLRAEHPH